MHYPANLGITNR